MAIFPIGTKLDDITGAFDRSTKVWFKCADPDHPAFVYASKDPYCSNIFVMRYPEDRDLVECNCPIINHITVSEYESIDY